MTGSRLVRIVVLNGDGGPDTRPPAQGDADGGKRSAPAVASRAVCGCS